ncbi:hypothetical protein G3I62_36720 [Streptomyces sp. SID14446]|nr:hypothetical protein [Streptomyces sp. SID14446]
MRPSCGSGCRCSRQRPVSDCRCPSRCTAPGTPPRRGRRRR